MQEELKLCPFCGGKAKIIIKTTNFGKGYGSRTDDVAIGCINKDCLILPRIAVINNREDCIKIWNKRAKERE